MKTDAERDTAPHKQLTLFDKGITAKLVRTRDLCNGDILHLG